MDAPPPYLIPYKRRARSRKHEQTAIPSYNLSSTYSTKTHGFSNVETAAENLEHIIRPESPEYRKHSAMGSLMPGWDACLEEKKGVCSNSGAADGEAALRLDIAC